MVKDPERHGLVWHFIRIYREKRRDQHPNSPRTFRMRRRVAAQIAWHQARNVVHCEQG